MFTLVETDKLSELSAKSATLGVIQHQSAPGMRSSKRCGGSGKNISGHGAHGLNGEWVYTKLLYVLLQESRG